MKNSNIKKYIEVDYLPSTDEISTRYKWDKKIESFVFNELTIIEIRNNPDLKRLKIENQPQKARLSDMINEHKSFLDGVVENTVYFNKKSGNEINEVFKKVEALVQKDFNNVDFVMNTVWDSYNTFVSNYDRFHFHTFVVQLKVKDLNQNKFMEVFYNPVSKTVNTDFSWNKNKKEYMRIPLN